MGKYIKFISGVIAALAIALPISLIIITHYIDPNNYRNQIERFVYDKTGRSCDIRGNMQWSFFPRIGITIPNVRIGNPKGVEGPDFAHIERLGLAARLLPLLTGKIDIDEVVLDKATINLIVEKNQQNNWQHWQARHQLKLQFYASLTPPHHALTPQKNRSMPIRTWRIRNILIHRSTMQLIDRQHDKTYQWRNVELAVHGFQNNRDFPVRLAYDFTPPVGKAVIQQRLTATAQVRPNTQQLSLPKLTIRTFLLRPGSDKLAIDIDGKLNANWRTKQLDLPEFTVQLANLKLTGQASLSQSNRLTQLSIQFSAQETELAPLIKALTGKVSLSGYLQSNGRFTGAWGSSQGFLSTLNGHGSVHIREGVLHGINLNSLIQQAIALTEGAKLSSATLQLGGETPFQSLQASYQVQHGILNNQDLVMHFKPYQAEGKGSINIATQQINYQLDLLGTGANQTSLTLPVVITGTLTHTSIRPNMGKIAEQFIKNEITRFINNPATRWQDKLKQLIP